MADWELPGFQVVPAVARYRYIKSDDREIQIVRPAGERKALYRQVLTQCALRVLAEVYRADEGGLVGSVTVNGFVSSADPATGQSGEVFLLTVMADRATFTRLELAKVDPVSCLERLKGQLSPRPDKLVPVHPGRLAGAAGAEMFDDGGQVDADLMGMDPIEFENLVAALSTRWAMK